MKHTASHVSEVSVLINRMNSPRIAQGREEDENIEAVRVGLVRLTSVKFIAGRLMDVTSYRK